ncbi:hypothetical protein B0H94_11830 [Salsuginibacillus halophilus]|uniref:Uncharacterized protein n=1 Tax=Salsuginibacillus halophilus TaxID=517424 RepID=A0A2P8H664_9BACI|nr:hypothetical protein [Salsuginibacillus halophilus]PSL41717.1 hypothetical protein B0H94_11830 [Salsuginibacillus halophilus]
MNRNDIEQALRDYYWMPSEVARLEQTLEEVDTNLTGQYGIESTMPKPQGANKDKIGKEVAGKRDKRHRQLDKLKRKITFVENGVNLIENDLERTIMFCMMDGMSQVAIAQHLRISEGKVNSIKERIITVLKENEGNERFERFEEKCEV